MSMAALRVLSVAVAKGRAGYSFLVGGDVKDWGVSVKAVTSTTEIAGWLQDLINRLKPNVVVSEKLTAQCRKGSNTKTLIAVAAEIASHNCVLDVEVERPRNHSCKYTEAAALAERYPEMRGWLPKKRKYWSSEPRNTILFEALALAVAVIDKPPEPNPAA